MKVYYKFLVDRNNQTTLIIYLHSKPKKGEKYVSREPSERIFLVSIFEEDFEPDWKYEIV